MVATGIECVGLALAVLPLLIALADHYHKAVTPVQTALRQDLRDEKLIAFYANLESEITLLHLNISELVGDLKDLSAEQEVRLRKLDAETWADPTVSQALSSRLGWADSAFVTNLHCILRILEHLVNDTTLRLSDDSIVGITYFISLPAINFAKHDSSLVYRRLKKLQKDVQEGRSKSDILERVRFGIKESKRANLLKKLKGYNKTIERLLKNTPHTGAYVNSSVSRRPPASDNKLRKFLNNLYNAMRKRWSSCSCQTGHEARLCLLMCNTISTESPPSTVDLDMLISVTPTASQKKWYESKVSITPEKKVAQSGQVRFVDDLSNYFNDSNAQSRHEIDSICKLIREAQLNNCTPCIKFDGTNLSQIRSQPKRFQNVDSSQSVSLERLLETKQSMTLKAKMILGVILAYTLLQFCEGPWLGTDWNKKKISFFHVSTGVDLLRPFLSTGFQDFLPTEDPQAQYRIHPHPSILALGILLLEIHLLEPIESHRLPEDLTEEGKPSLNTDLFTAMRLLQQSDGNMFLGRRKAIEACLKWNIVPSDFGVVLDDEGVRQAVYENIIAPLEDELFYGFKQKVEDIRMEALRATNNCNNCI